MITIYLSSASASLSEAIERELQLMEHFSFVMSAEIMPGRAPSLASHLEVLAACDLYIGLLSWDDGYIPAEDNPERKSLVELEYRKAIELGKPCLLFLAEETKTRHGTPTSLSSALLTLRRELAETHTVHYFSTPEHLVSLVGLALLQWEQQLAQAPNALEAIARLPHWWRYNLLRCSLREHSTWAPAALLAAGVLLREGHEQEALALADRLTELAPRVHILVETARSLIGHGENAEYAEQLLTKAHVLARGIEDPRQRYDALTAVCAAFAHARRWERAKATLSVIKDARAAVIAGGKLCAELLRAAQPQMAAMVWGRAKAEAAAIEQPAEQALALCLLGQEVAQAYAARWASAAWQAALQHPESETHIEPILAKARKDFALHMVRTWHEPLPGQGGRSDLPADRQIIEHALHHVQAIHNEALRARALCELGGAFAERAQWDYALQVWRKAQETALLLEDRAECVRILGELSVALAECNTEEATKLSQEIFSQAEYRITEIEDAHARGVVYWELGAAYACAQRMMRAEICWREAEERTPAFVAGRDNAGGLYRLVVALARQQRWPQAQELAHAIRDERRRDEAFSHLSIALARAQQWELAQKTLKAIVDPRISQQTLLEHGRCRAEERQWELAWESWREAARLEYLLAECAERTAALSELGLILARAQRREQAREIWQWAQVAARLIAEPAQRAEALCKLGAAWAEVAASEESDDASYWLDEALRLWMAAETAARQVQPDWVASKLLRHISAALARAGQWERAEATAQLIDEAWADRAEALCTLVLALIEARQWRRAVDVTHHIKERRVRARVLRQLAQVFLQEQQWDLATTAARMIGEHETRTQILCELGMARMQAQQSEQAAATWNEAEESARMITTTSYRAQALYRLGVIYARAHQYERAQQLWVEAKQTLPLIETTWQRLAALRECGALLMQEAEEQAQRGQELKAHAQELWTTAEALARSLPMDRDRAIALIELAEELENAQLYQHAARLWDETETIVDGIEEVQVRTQLQRLLVMSLLQVKQWARAEAIAGRIEGVWASRDETLRELADQFAAAHRWARAETMIAGIHEQRLRAEALRELGVTISQVQPGRRADMIWSAAERAAGAVEPAVSRAEALRKLGASLWQERHPERARAAWWQAEISAYAIEGNDERLYALHRLASTLVDAGEHEQLLHMVQRAWSRARTRGAAIQLLPLATSLLQRQPETAYGCFQAFAWVEQLLERWSRN